jgi:cell division ATPase FtsA
MTESSLSRLQQLQREQFALRELLDSKLSDVIRPHIEELFCLVREEIDRERERMKATGQAA